MAVQRASGNVQAGRSPDRLQYGCQRGRVTVWLIRALLICTALISRLSLFQSRSVCACVGMHAGVCLCILSEVSVTLCGNLERLDSLRKVKRQNICRLAFLKLCPSSTSSSSTNSPVFLSLISFMAHIPSLVFLHLAPDFFTHAHSSHSLNECSRVSGSTISSTPVLVVQLLSLF